MSNLQTEEEHQLDKKIKIVPSDRGGEYYGRYNEIGQLMALLQDICKNEIVLLFIPCMMLLIKMEVVERQTRTLIDTGRSMIRKIYLLEWLLVEHYKLQIIF